MNPKVEKMLRILRDVSKSVIQIMDVSYLKKHQVMLAGNVMIVDGSCLQLNPTAKIIAGMSASTTKVLRFGQPHPDDEEPEMTSETVHHTLQNGSFEENEDCIGCNPTYCWHLIGSKILKHSGSSCEGFEAYELQKALIFWDPSISLEALRILEAWKACPKKRIATSIIYHEYHVDRMKMNEWEVMHPNAQLCSKV
jgi:hypothetical protein